MLFYLFLFKIDLLLINVYIYYLLYKKGLLINVMDILFMLYVLYMYVNINIGIMLNIKFFIGLWYYLF